MEKKRLINMIGALAILLIYPIVLLLTVDFSQPMASTRFILTCFGIFLAVYFAIALPAHFLTKKLG